MPITASAAIAIMSIFRLVIKLAYYIQAETLEPVKNKEADAQAVRQLLVHDDDEKTKLYSVILSGKLRLINKYLFSVA
jgi:hypothetical protein